MDAIWNGCSEIDYDLVLVFLAIKCEEWFSTLKRFYNGLKSAYHKILDTFTIKLIASTIENYELNEKLLPKNWKIEQPSNWKTVKVRRKLRKWVMTCNEPKKASKFSEEPQADPSMNCAQKSISFISVNFKFCFVKICWKMLFEEIYEIYEKFSKFLDFMMKKVREGHDSCFCCLELFQVFQLILFHCTLKFKRQIVFWIWWFMK